MPRPLRAELMKIPRLQPTMRLPRTSARNNRPPLKYWTQRHESHQESDYDRCVPATPSHGSDCSNARVAVLAAAALSKLSGRGGAEAVGPTPDIHYVPMSSGVADAMPTLARVTAKRRRLRSGPRRPHPSSRRLKKYGAAGCGRRVGRRTDQRGQEERAMKGGVSG